MKVTKLIAIGLLTFSAAVRAETDADPWPLAIRAAVLSEERPLYVQLNPKVTTTLRFPIPLQQDPVGIGFWVERESDTQSPPPSVEYILAWDQNDTRLDIQARSNATLRNLNVSLAGKTYVIVCYPAARPLEASAVVNLKFQEKLANARGSEDAEKEKKIRRVEVAPASPYESMTPAREIGMLDRLHLIHGAQPADLNALVKSMPKISISQDAIEEDEGPFTSTILRVVRDDRIDLIGFVILLKNTSKAPIDFDQTGSAARIGAVYLPQLTAEIPQRLNPGQVAPAYIVVEGGGRMHAPLQPKNAWLVSFKFSLPASTPLEHQDSTDHADASSTNQAPDAK